MPYRKKTLARILPTQREVALLIGDLERVTRRLKKILPALGNYEALAKAAHKTPPRPADWKEQDMLRKVSHDLPF